MREAARRKKPVYIHGELSRFPQYEDEKKQADYRHWRRVTGQLDGSPGPGFYEERSSLFEQASSRKPTLPRARGLVRPLTHFTRECFVHRVPGAQSRIVRSPAVYS